MVVRIFPKSFWTNQWNHSAKINPTLTKKLLQICFYKYVFVWTYERLRMRSNMQELSTRVSEHSSTWHFWLPQADSPKCLFYQEIMITIVTAPARPYHLHFNLSNHGNLVAGTVWWFRSQHRRQKSENTQPSLTDPGEDEKMFVVHCDCSVCARIYQWNFVFIYLFIYFATSEEKFPEA